MGWYECFDPFSGDGDLYTTGDVEVNFRVNVKINMVNGSNVLELGEKLMWVNFLGGGGVGLFFS